MTNAIFDAGCNSNSRFYEKSNEVLGMMPSSYRGGGSGAEIRFAIGECSLGSILVAQSGRGICAILLGDDPDKLARDLQDGFPRANPWSVEMLILSSSLPRWSALSKRRASV